MTNTCAFDSLLQIIAVGIMNSTTYEQISKSSTCRILKLAYHLAMIGADKDFYRNRILSFQVYAKKIVLPVGIIEYDARSNTNVVVERLFQSVPSIIQFNACNNIKCKQTIISLPTFPINLMQLFTGS